MQYAATSRMWAVQWVSEKSLGVLLAICKSLRVFVEATPLLETR